MIYVAARGRRADIRSMRVASLAGEIVAELPSPKRAPFLLRENVWGNHRHLWGVFSAVNFHSARFTSPTCRTDMDIHSRLEGLRPPCMVTGETAASLRRWLVDADDWEELFYVFSVEVFLSTTVYAAVEQGLRFLRYRASAAEWHAPVQGSPVARSARRVLDYLSTQRVWKVTDIDSYVHCTILSKKSLGLVTGGIRCEYNLPLTRHPWYPRQACVSFRSLSWREVQILAVVNVRSLRLVVAAQHPALRRAYRWSLASIWTLR